MGSGITMKQGDIAFKCNFAYINEETQIVERRRVDRQFPLWGLNLPSGLNGLKVPDFPEYEITCKYATEHRCAINIHGPNLSPAITGTDPLKDGLKKVTCKAEDPHDKKAVHTAELINALDSAITQKLN